MHISVINKNFYNSYKVVVGGFGLASGVLIMSNAFCKKEPHAKTTKLKILYMNAGYYKLDVSNKERENGIKLAALNALIANKEYDIIFLQQAEDLTRELIDSNNEKRKIRTHDDKALLLFDRKRFDRDGLHLRVQDATMVPMQIDQEITCLFGAARFEGLAKYAGESDMEGVRYVNGDTCLRQLLRETDNHPLSILALDLNMSDDPRKGDGGVTPARGTATQTRRGLLKGFQLIEQNESVLPHNYLCVKAPQGTQVTMAREASPVVDGFDFQEFVQKGLFGSLPYVVNVTLTKD